jgi:predicted Fe-Mo cluster-binding NifX family protein
MHARKIVTTVAVPIWQGRVSPVFDEARSLMVVCVEHGRTVRRSTYALQDGTWSRLRTMLDLRVDVLLCGAITQSLAGQLEAAGVEVLSQVRGPAAAAVDAYLRAAGLMTAPTSRSA